VDILVREGAERGVEAVEGVLGGFRESASTRWLEVRVGRKGRQILIKYSGDVAKY
jgi:hypothetical protein